MRRKIMTRDFYVTKSVLDTLDLSLITKIDAAICSVPVDLDYLQVFDILGDRLIHTQEVPEYTREYLLDEKHEDCKLFVIKTEEQNRRYWTVMYANEY
jgi:hypothetical protein